MGSGVNAMLEAIGFEKKVKPSDVCLARWTWCGYYLQGKVEVVTVNLKSFGVTLLEDADGGGLAQYKAGQRLNIPNLLNWQRWSANNRLAPLK